MRVRTRRGTESCRCSTTTSAIPNVSPVFDPDWRANGHMAEAVDLIAGWCRAQAGRRPHARGRRARRSHPGDPDGDPRLRDGLERRHRAALRPPRQAARDGGLARGPRPVDAGARGRPAVRARRRRRRLRRLRQPHRDRGGARGRRLARPLRRAHRGERGVRIARPAVLHRGPGRPHRHAEPRDLPRFGLHRLRAAVGHHVVAGARVGHAAGRHRHRGRALRRRVGHGALDVPDRPHAARPRRGRPDRRDPRPGTHRRDPGEPGARGRTTPPPRSGASPTTTPSSTAPARRRTTRPSSCCRARGTRRSAWSAPTGCPASPAPATCCGRARRSSCRSASRRRAIRWRRSPRSRPCSRPIRPTAPACRSATARAGRAGTPRRLAPWLDAALESASTATFGQPTRTFGEGGSIPFMGMLGERFPEAQFVITGVLGPDAQRPRPQRVPAPADRAAHHDGDGPSARRTRLALARRLTGHDRSSAADHGSRTGQTVRRVHRRRRHRHHGAARRGVRIPRPERSGKDVDDADDRLRVAGVGRGATHLRARSGPRRPRDQVAHRRRAPGRSTRRRADGAREPGHLRAVLRHQPSRRRASGPPNCSTSSSSATAPTARSTPCPAGRSGG